MQRIYNSNIRFRWAEAKRRLNLHLHGLDLADAPLVFGGPTLTVEDARFEYPERRFITVGLLDGKVVLVAHTEDEHEIRIISFRNATRREAASFLASIAG